MTAKKVLIIDDDPTHLLYTQELLEADGHQVIVNRTGFGSTMKVLKERPDLVLLDVNMPGLSGEAVAALLEPCAKDRPFAVLLYSSNDDESLRRTAAELGVHGYVMKGDPGALRAAVQRTLATLSA